MRFTSGATRSFKGEPDFDASNGLKNLLEESTLNALRDFLLSDVVDENGRRVSSRVFVDSELENPDEAVLNYIERTKRKVVANSSNPLFIFSDSCYCLPSGGTCLQLGEGTALEQVIYQIFHNGGLFTAKDRGNVLLLLPNFAINEFLFDTQRYDEAEGFLDFYDKNYDRLLDMLTRTGCFSESTNAKFPAEDTEYVMQHVPHYLQDEVEKLSSFSVLLNGIGSLFLIEGVEKFPIFREMTRRQMRTLIALRHELSSAEFRWSKMMRPRNLESYLLQLFPELNPVITELLPHQKAAMGSSPVPFAVDMQKELRALSKINDSDDIETFIGSVTSKLSSDYLNVAYNLSKMREHFETWEFYALMFALTHANAYAGGRHEDSMYVTNLILDKPESVRVPLLKAVASYFLEPGCPPPGCASWIALLDMPDDYLSSIAWELPSSLLFPMLAMTKKCYNPEPSFPYQRKAVKEIAAL